MFLLTSDTKSKMWAEGFESRHQAFKQCLSPKSLLYSYKIYISNNFLSIFTILNLSTDLNMLLVLFQTHFSDYKFT
jgi:hypothetical protein